MILRDVVIPFHPKDEPTVKACCESLRETISPQRIFLISTLDPGLENTIFIDEKEINSVLGLEDIKSRWVQENPNLSSRSGWLYQQILKLGADEIVKDISEDFLVCDSDIIFLQNPYKQIENNKFPFAEAFTGEYHKPYRESYERLMKSSPKSGFSFINHNMVFNSKKLKKLKNHIESLNHKRWDAAILDSVNFSEASCFSEYDLYGNWNYETGLVDCVSVDMRILQVPFIPPKQFVDDLKKSKVCHIISSQEWNRSQ